jgi:hypothetical protein
MIKVSIKKSKRQIFGDGYVYIILGHLYVGHSSFLVWSEKILFIIFLSVGHYKFMNLSVRHHTVSVDKKNSKKLSNRHCTVSHRQIYEFIVSHKNT